MCPARLLGAALDGSGVGAGIGVAIRLAEVFYDIPDCRT